MSGMIPCAGGISVNHESKDPMLSWRVHFNGGEIVGKMNKKKKNEMMLRGKKKKIIKLGSGNYQGKN